MAARALCNLCEVEVVYMRKHLADTVFPIPVRSNNNNNQEKDEYIIYVYMLKQS